MRSAGLLWVVLCLLGLLPLFGGLRYEAALLAGLLGPSFAAVAATAAARRRLNDAPESPELGLVAARSGVWHGAALLAAALLHGALFGFCEPLQGLWLFLLGPVSGTLLGAAFGVTVAVAAWLLRPELLRGRASPLLGLLGPLVTAAYAGAEFYFGPSIYAFDPFAGYFAGPLYDSIPFELERLALFRLGSLFTLLGFACLVQGLACERAAARTRLRLVSTKWALGGALCLGVSATHAGLQTRLGLETTTGSLAAALDRTIARGPCQVSYSKWVPERDAARLAWECRGHVRQLRAHFGLAGEGPRLQVWLFSNAEEKGRLIGARTTNIAKPWRREVYVVSDAFPHPVLGHELAHAVSAEFGRGPFRIAGTLGGLWPDPGRIEGFAVAASPAEQGEATEAEWARAMLDLGVLPPARSLFSLGFLGSAAVVSYTAAGSFVAHLHARYGPSVMQRWYRGEDLEALTESSWAALDAAYRKELTSIPLSARLRGLAAEIFRRPSVFGRRCPHEADRALEEAQALCPLNAPAAERALARTLWLDGTKQDARGLLPGCWLAAGDLRQAEVARQTVLEAPGVTEREKTRARVLGADLAWRAGRSDVARRGYEEALSGPLALAEWRAVRLEMWALDQPPHVQVAVQELLGPRVALGGDAARQVFLLDAWRAQGPAPGLAAYLLGLRLLEVAPSEGRALLEGALGSGDLEPEFAAEAARRLLLGACLGEDRELVARRSKDLVSRTDSRLALLLAQRLTARCLEAR